MTDHIVQHWIQFEIHCSEIRHGSFETKKTVAFPLEKHLGNSNSPKGKWWQAITQWICMRRR